MNAEDANYPSLKDQVVFVTGGGIGHRREHRRAFLRARRAGDLRRHPATALASAGENGSAHAVAPARRASSTAI